MDIAAVLSRIRTGGRGQDRTRTDPVRCEGRLPVPPGDPYAAAPTKTPARGLRHLHDGSEQMYGISRERVIAQIVEA